MTDRTSRVLALAQAALAIGEPPGELASVTRHGATALESGVAIVVWLAARGTLAGTPCGALRHFADPETPRAAKAPLGLPALVGVLAREGLVAPDWAAPHLVGLAPSFPEALAPKKRERKVVRPPDEEDVHRDVKPANGHERLRAYGIPRRVGT